MSRPPTHPILVLGATGNVGAEVVRGLLAAGAPVRAADPDPERVRSMFGPQIEAVPFDFARPDTFAPAFEGVRRMFLLRPPPIADVKRFIIPAVQAAQAAGVQHVVFLSLIGIEKNRRAPHYEVEKYLLGSGLAYTFLRPSFFMQNLNTTHRDEIRLHNEIAVPVGRARTAFIDVRDIGAVAALALTQPGHENRAYDLTGPEALDYDEVARVFSEVLGRTITYRSPSLLRFIRDQRAKGTPMSFTMVMALLYTTTSFGAAEKVTREVERLTGRPPISLRQYVQDYRAAWV